MCKVPRPPIHNPYDKFTQPEFEAWIGDITGALKRALGREDAPSLPIPASRGRAISDEDEGGVEDSFAEVRARRLAKGKERAREEDFEDEEHPFRQVDENGLSMTFYGEHYRSSSEEEEQEDGEAPDREAEIVDLLSDDDEDAGIDEQPVAVACYDEAIANLIFIDDDEDAGSEGSSDEKAVECVSLEEDVEELEGSQSRSDDGRHERQSSPAAAPSPVYDVTEISDSDEEPEQEGKFPEQRAIPARFMRKPGDIASAHLVDYEVKETDEDKVQTEEEVEPFPPRTEQHDIVDIEDPWRGSRAFAEDYYSSGDLPPSALERGNPHILPTESDEPDELLNDGSPQSPEVQDPWEGPRTYAEDFYAGGDIRLESGGDATPSHLTPHDDGVLFIPGISPAPEEPSQPALDAREVVNIDDLYGEDTLTDVREQVEDIDEGDAVEDKDERSPSPPSPTLTTHVDWNWPPAFPGKIATGPGHLASSAHKETIPISDDEDAGDTPVQGFPPQADKPAAVKSAAFANTSNASAGLGAMSFYPDFGLYDMGPSGSSRGMDGAYEPVSPNGVDFGDLPPSRAEHLQSTQVMPFENGVYPEDMSVGVEPVSADARMDVGAVEDLVDDDGRPSGASVDIANQPVAEEIEDNDAQLFTASKEISDAVSIPADDVQTSTFDYLVEEAVTESRLTWEPDPASSNDIPGEPGIHTETGESHLQIYDKGAEASAEYPAPVSADPTVPDPASIAITLPSPVSPTRPRTDSIASSSGDVESEPVPTRAALLPMFRKISTAHSPSGLFTPLTDGNSGSVTPELQQDVVDVTVDAKPETSHNQPEAVVPDLSPVRVYEAVDDAFGELPDENGHLDEHRAPPDAIVVTSEDAAVLPQEVVSASGAVIIEMSGGVPSASPQRQGRVAESTDAGRKQTPGTDVDADAEGDVDSDYVLSEDEVADDSSVAAAGLGACEVIVADDESIPPETTAAAENTAVRAPATMEEDDPFIISGMAPFASAQEKDVKRELEDSAEGLSLAEIIVAAVEPTSEGQTKVTPSQQIVIDEVRPLKRKRTSPAVESLNRQLLSRATKSVDTDRAWQPTTKSKRGKGKGKQRARAESDDEDAASAAHSVASQESSGSSSVAAQQLLIPASRSTSRASSVVSNAPSTYSGASQPSPTAMRTLINNGNQQPPPPFVHDNGVLRHHHGTRPILPATQAPVRRRPSRPPSNAGEQSQGASAEPECSQPSPPSFPLQPSLPPPSSPSSSALQPSIPSSTSSPVTRANCRYHTISLLQNEEENSRRLFFAVPSCSLGNGELMKEESIEDHGYVHGEDIPKLVTNVQDLNLSPYLLGVLRQLVGVDLLREQEVLYLPRPGDKVGGKRGKRRAHHVQHTQVDSISAAQRETISARTLSNGAPYRKKDPPKTLSLPPPSQASVSTSGGSASYAGKLSERASIVRSFSGSDLSDLDDGEEMPPAKRTKDSHPEPESEPEQEPTGLAEAQPAQAEKVNESTSVGHRKPPPRRSKRLGIDAAAYKPEGGESDGSDGGEEDAEATKKRKRALKKRGLKRTRTEEVAHAPTEGSSEKSKRRRIRAGDKVVAEAT